ncbi:MAG: DUF4149 domain-containing protein [Vampirovibrionales bacterium]
MPTVFTYASFSYYLGLSLMIGGLLSLGAIAASALFKHLPREDAGWVMTVMFRRFDTLLMVALLLVALGSLGLNTSGYALFHEGCPLWGNLQPRHIRSVLLVILGGCILYTTYGLNPKLEAYQIQKQEGLVPLAPGQTTQFMKWHTLSEKLAKLQMLLAILCLPYGV